MKQNGGGMIKIEATSPKSPPNEVWYCPVSMPDWLDNKEFQNRLHDYLKTLKKQREET